MRENNESATVQTEKMSEIDPKEKMGFNRSIEGVKKFEASINERQRIVFFAKEQPDYENVFGCAVIEKTNEDGISQGKPKHHWINVEHWPQIRKGLDAIFSEIQKATKPRENA